MLLHLPLLARPNCLSLVTPAPPVISRQSPPRMQAFRLAQFIAFGYVNFGARGFRRNEKTFTPNVLDVHLTDKHYIVTGATSGLGRITAEQLAHRGASVHLLCRDAKRAQAIQEDIMRKTTNENITVHLCDMSSLADVVAFSREWEESGLPIHALVNNAGVMLHSRKQSADGIETNFATNSLGTFALTEMLRPALERSKGARVVTVSSGGMLTQGLEVDDFEGTSLSKGDSIDGSAQYSRSKRHQVAMTEYWARKYADSGIFWASMHPGWAGTPGVR